MLSRFHRLSEIVRAIRNTVATTVHAVLRVMAITWTLPVLLLLLLITVLLSVFLLAVGAGPLVRLIRLFLLLLLLLLLLLDQSAQAPPCIPSSSLTCWYR